jgi:pilus assembly protein CpaB
MATRKAFFMFLFAVLLAGAAAWLANVWVQERVNPGQKAEGVQTTKVLVAGLEIPFGTRIEAVHVRAVDWPLALVPEGSVNELAEVEGMVASQGFLPGEVILKARLANHLGGSTLAALVEPQKRAVTVRVNDVVGVGGFLLPGNRVDVVATRSNPGSRQAVTRTVLEDLKVLAVDQTASADKDRPVVVRAVTLEVTPAEAEVLVKATGEGSVQLTLRNPLDKERVVREEERRTRPQPAPPTVTVIRGADVSVVRTGI